MVIGPGLLLSMLLAIGPAASLRAAERAPLVLEATIPLGPVNGRIDHLTVDLWHGRLFVAELGNDSVGVIDLKSSRLLRTMTGLKEPQGIVYAPATDELYVANGGNGSVQVFHGPELAATATIELGEDADNLRLDAARGRVIAGYGGGLAMIDTASHRVMAHIPLQGHPEGFQLSVDGRRAFVNVPVQEQLVVADLESRRRIATWSTAELRSNFPMAMESSGAGLWVAFRSPPRLVRFDVAAGKATLSLSTCGDSDDVFLDSTRRRIYVICGSGAVEVWEQAGGTYLRITSLPTAAGARTGLFVPELDCLFIATRTGSGQPASIRVYRPDP